MASLIAQSFLVLLTPHLEKLTKENIRKISLRVNLEPDNVCIMYIFDYLVFF